MVTPNSSWENLIRLLAAVWLLFGLVRGWGNGPFRLLVKPAAWLIALAVVRGFAAPAAAALASGTAWPLPACFLLASLGLGTVAYQVSSVVGRAFFKRTRDHDGFGARLLLGTSGAALGLAYNLLLLWIVVIAFRVAGHLASDQVTVDQARGARPGAAAPALASTQDVVERAFGKGTIDRFDPFPRAFYARLDQLRRLASDPGAVARLVAYPGFQRIWADPRLRALENDPELARAWLRNDYLAMASNPRLWTLLNSPDFWETFIGPQLDGAFRYALDGT